MGRYIKKLFSLGTNMSLKTLCARNSTVLLRILLQSQVVNVFCPLFSLFILIFVFSNDSCTTHHLKSKQWTEEESCFTLR